MIVKEPANPKVKTGMNLTPFSRFAAARFQYIAKENESNAKLGEQLTFANRQIVVQFGLHKRLTRSILANTAEDSSGPIDMDTIPDLLGDGMDLDSKTDSTINNTKAILGGLSVVASNTKLSDSVTSSDVEKVVAAFANDLADGKADGLDVKGETVLIQDELSLASNPLTTTLQTAVSTYVTTDPSLGITATDVANISFIQEPVFVQPIPIEQPLSVTYLYSPYSFLRYVPISISPVIVGNVTNCTVSPALPAGLSLNSTTCAITGSVSVLQSATDYTVTATNSGGSRTTKISIEVRTISTTALNVWGQPDFNSSINSDGLFLPSSVKVDANGVYIVDSYNSRVLFYPTNSTTPTRIYGQLGKYTTSDANKGGISADSLNYPNFVETDATGVYIADLRNSRVLYYPGTSTTATRVYGQGGSFTTATANKGGISANALAFPSCITVSGSDVYIADKDNSRILHYTGTSTTADRVYGQGGSFTTNPVNNGGITANSLNVPWGVVVDAGGVYIVDSKNHRVLYYPGTSTTATRVYGQGGSYTSNTLNNGGLSMSSLNEPSYIATNGSDVYISDSRNYRVLHYTGTGTTADRTYTGTPQQILILPQGVAIYGSEFYVAGTYDNRVLRYTGTSTVADKVYGQCGDLTTGISNISCSNKDLLVAIIDMFVDSNGGLYIPDQQRNRVVYYSGINSYVPLRVYGQGGSLTTMTPNKGGISANSLYNPKSVVVDKSGTYIADCYNQRVLFYPGTSTTATRVYGQNGSFITRNANPSGVSANSLWCPIRLALDASGLYVVDNGNHRVLHFPGTSTTADRVYGQPNFTSNTANNGGVSATSLDTPYGIAVDESGVYISDWANSRILYYSGTSTTATRVYGQGGSFTTNTATTTASGLNYVASVSLDSSGLYASEFHNHRALFFPGTSTTATQVWGHNGLFTSNAKNLGGVSASTLYAPMGIFVHRTGLYIADSYNNRVLRY